MDTWITYSNVDSSKYVGSYLLLQILHVKFLKIMIQVVPVFRGKKKIS